MRAKKAKKIKEVVVATRIPLAVDKMVEEAIFRDLHVTRSEFVRDAIIEYVKNNWPDIYDKYRGVRKLKGEEK